MVTGVPASRVPGVAQGWDWGAVVAGFGIVLCLFLVVVACRTVDALVECCVLFGTLDVAHLLVSAYGELD